MKFRPIIRLIGLCSLCLGWSLPSVAQNGPKPKLVVQIVISQMRYDYLQRFYDNFSQSGFRTFLDQGVTYTNAYYNYMQTNTEAGLATLSTGTSPAQHGVIAPAWIDFTTGNRINLIEDRQVKGLDCEEGDGCYSPINLTAATLGDRLKESDPASKVLSIALSPASAIISGGASADVYWCYPDHGTWVSSSFYFPELPAWVKQYNSEKHYTNFLDRNWEPSRPFDSYRNTDRSVIDFVTEKKFRLKDFFKNLFTSSNANDERFDVEALQYSPFGNSLVTHFARQAIISEALGKDEHTDLLTICYDTPRYVSEHFGPRSIELEDMYYKLDAEIGEMIQFIFSQVKPEEAIIVLTSDHGTSDTFREPSRIPMGQFNADQFKMIMNGFLSAQYEPGNWIIDYIDRQLYLNREMIYKYGFDLTEVQTRAANFALQFRGVSAAMTASAMQSGYFGKGYAEKMQNSFYPKRSGDILINLMPGWIELRERVLSMSGSLYEYDTHVPLMWLGGGIGKNQIDRTVSLSDVAPTLARILQIPVPNASTGTAMEEIVR